MQDNGDTGEFFDEFEDEDYEPQEEPAVPETLELPEDEDNEPEPDTEPIEEPHDFDTIWQLWDSFFEEYNWNNPVYHQILFHVLIGQLFKNISIRKGGVELDGRVSALIIQDQGTGKNTAFTPFAKICSEIDRRLLAPNAPAGLNKEKAKERHEKFTRRLRAVSLDEFSDSATIGSIQLFFDPNAKTEGLKGETIAVKDEANETTAKIEVDKTNPKIIRRFIYGVFSKEVSDIIMVREAKTIFSTHRRENSNIIGYQNTAMESIWSEHKIVKYLNAGKISCESEASFIETTYPTEDFDYELLVSGNLRRFLVYYNPIPLSKKIMNVQIGLDKLQKNEEEYQKFDKTWGLITGGDNSKAMELIVSYIIDKYLYYYNNKTSDEGKIILSFDNDAVEEMKRYITEKMTKFGEYPEEFSSIVSSIFTTYSDTALAIAAHRAILNNKTNVSLEDIKYAEELITKITDSVINFASTIFAKIYKDKYTKLEKSHAHQWRYVYVETLKKYNWSLDYDKFAKIVKNTYATFGVEGKRTVTDAAIRKNLKKLQEEGIVSLQYENNSGNGKTTIKHITLLSPDIIAKVKGSINNNDEQAK